MTEVVFFLRLWPSNRSLDQFLRTCNFVSELSEGENLDFRNAIETAGNGMLAKTSAGMEGKKKGREGRTTVRSHDKNVEGERVGGKEDYCDRYITRK